MQNINSHDSINYAKLLDDQDPLSHLRNEFHIPIDENNDRSLAYFLNNSLGLQPKNAKKLVLEELDSWKRGGVSAYFENHHPYDRPWTTIDDECIKLLTPLIGAYNDEVAITGTLTTNLHLLMTAFYRPNLKRYKILVEEHIFPSDYVIHIIRSSIHSFSVYFCSMQ